jgi:hypothetical protein
VLARLIRKAVATVYLAKAKTTYLSKANKEEKEERRVRKEKE